MAKYEVPQNGPFTNSSGRRNLTGKTDFGFKITLSENNFKNLNEIKNSTTTLRLKEDNESLSKVQKAIGTQKKITYTSESFNNAMAGQSSGSGLTFKGGSHTISVKGDTRPVDLVSFSEKIDNVDKPVHFSLPNSNLTIGVENSKKFLKISEIIDRDKFIALTDKIKKGYEIEINNELNKGKNSIVKNPKDVLSKEFNTKIELLVAARATLTKASKDSAIQEGVGEYVEPETSVNAKSDNKNVEALRVQQQKEAENQKKQEAKRQAELGREAETARREAEKARLAAEQKATEEETTRKQAEEAEKLRLEQQRQAKLEAQQKTDLLKQQQGKIDGLETQLADLKVELKNQTDQARGYGDQVVDLANENDTLLTQIKELNAKIADWEKTIADQAQQIDAQDRQIDELGGKLLKAEEQNSKNEQKIEALESSLKQAQNDLNQANLDANTKNKENQDLKNIVSDLKGTISDQSNQIEAQAEASKVKDGQIQDLSTQNKNLNLELQQKDEQVEANKRNIEGLTFENEALSKDNVRLKEELDEQTKNNNKLSTELNKAEQDLQNKSKLLQTSAEDLAKSQAEVATLSAQNTNLGGKIDELTNKNNKSEKENLEFKTENGRLKAIIAKQGKDINTLQWDFNALSIENEDLKQEAEKQRQPITETSYDNVNDTDGQSKNFVNNASTQADEYDFKNTKSNQRKNSSDSDSLSDNNSSIYYSDDDNSFGADPETIELRSDGTAIKAAGENFQGGKNTFSFEGFQVNVVNEQGATEAKNTFDAADFSDTEKFNALKTSVENAYKDEKGEVSKDGQAKLAELEKCKTVAGERQVTATNPDQANIHQQINKDGTVSRKVELKEGEACIAKNNKGALCAGKREGTGNTNPEPFIESNGTKLYYSEDSKAFLQALQDKFPEEKKLSFFDGQGNKVQIKDGKAYDADGNELPAVKEPNTKSVDSEAKGGNNTEILENVVAPKVDRLSNPSLDNLKFDLSDNTDVSLSASIADSETSVLSDGRFVRSEEKVAAVIAKLKSASEKVPGTGSASEVLERLSVQVDKNKPQLNTTKAPNPEVTNQVNIPQAAKPAVTEEVTLVVKTDHVKTLKERREAPSSKGPGPAALK